MIPEGGQSLLMDILHLSRRREQTSKCSQGSIKLNINLMFEKLNEIPCVWIILDAW